MVSCSRVGSVPGRLFTRIVKFYLAGKFINAAALKTANLAEDHKINSKNPEIVI